MTLRQSTITQSYAPAYRRKFIASYLHLSMPQIPKESQQDAPKIKNTQDFHRMLLKAKQNYQDCQQTYKKINVLIDHVDEIIRKRMQVHEEGLMSVVKLQIQKMQENCRRVVEQYNEMICLRNKQSQIYSLRNQLDYFRGVALRLFQENRILRQENVAAKYLVKNKDSIINDLNQILKKVKKKCMKQKMINERAGAISGFVRNITDISSQINDKKTISNEIKNNNQTVNIEIDKISAQLTTDRYSHSNSNRVMAGKHIRTHTNTFYKRFFTDGDEKQQIITKATTTKVNNHGKSKSFWKFQHGK